MHAYTGKLGSGVPRITSRELRAPNHSDTANRLRNVYTTSPSAITACVTYRLQTCDSKLVHRSASREKVYFRASVIVQQSA